MVENKHNNKILKASPPNLIVGIYSFRIQKTFPFLILGVLGGYGGVIRRFGQYSNSFQNGGFLLLNIC